MTDMMSKIRNGEVEYCILRSKVTTIAAPGVVRWEWSVVTINEDEITELRLEKAQKREEYRGPWRVPTWEKEIDRKRALRMIEEDGMIKVADTEDGQVYELPGQPFKKAYNEMKYKLAEEGLLR